MGKPASLPLFRKAELDALQKRLQGKPPHSHGRIELLGRLKVVTAEILALETGKERRP